MNIIEQINYVLVGSATFVGMLLGIYYFCMERSKSKVSLKLTPKSAKNIRPWYDGYEGQEDVKTSLDEFSITREDHLLLDIVNLSTFPVIVCEVGLACGKRKEKLAVAIPDLIEQGDWPRRIGPRKRITLNIPWEKILILEESPRVTKAYASTECGTTVYGTSPALKKLASEF